jgi:hypothetical protein
VFDAPPIVNGREEWLKSEPGTPDFMETNNQQAKRNWNGIGHKPMAPFQYGSHIDNLPTQHLGAG